MLHIGCHLSSSDGFEAMGKTALEIGADTFQFFTRNPRGSKAKAIDPKDAAALCTLLKENHFAPIIAHAPYTLNPASAEATTREFALLTMQDDLNRMEYVPGNLYNFHPGSHVGQGVEKGTQFIIELLNEILTSKQTTTVLLETMSGKGSEIGGRFDELKRILDGVKLNKKMGVCLDTCHINDAGYDLTKLDDVLTEFDKQIGLKLLKAVHLNDSLNPVGAHKDRHAVIGGGTIGTKTLATVINHPALKNLPFCLETPNDLDGYAREIKLLRSLAR
ncbi:deoxyribonuclease IV [Candidatus Avelusimicrobium caledoniensis]|uniref:deoxyribonuclease IV n=1 Tax=Candidatus Avelusimicrobium caledoniensis TaxID=3416220 RepID=UPI003D0EF87E